jgi:hypothetical protein
MNMVVVWSREGRCTFQIGAHKNTAAGRLKYDSSVDRICSVQKE